MFITSGVMAREELIHDKLKSQNIKQRNKNFLTFQNKKYKYVN